MNRGNVLSFDASLSLGYCVCGEMGLIDQEGQMEQLRQEPTPEQVTAFAIRLGRERLDPSRRNPDYLSLIERRKQIVEALRHIQGNRLRVLDIGGRIQPYRPLFNGRLETYVAVDPLKTGLVDVMGTGENLPFT